MPGSNDGSYTITEPDTRYNHELKGPLETMLLMGSDQMRAVIVINMLIPNPPTLATKKNHLYFGRRMIYFFCEVHSSSLSLSAELSQA